MSGRRREVAKGTHQNIVEVGTNPEGRAEWAELKRLGALREEQKRVERNVRAKQYRHQKRYAGRAQPPEQAATSRIPVSPSKAKRPVPVASTPATRKRKKVAADYQRPAYNRRERLSRRAEQRRIARDNRREWRKLTYWERRKRTRLGTNAWCYNAEDVRALSRITGKIAHERELEAIRRWKLTPEQLALFKAICGFKPTFELIASNKRVRMESAESLATQMIPFFKRSPHLHFYFVTIINDAWHTRHDDTEIDLDDIYGGISRAMERGGLNWLGMVEIDHFNNYPGGGRGLWITPHGHLLVWSRKKLAPDTLADQISSAGRFLTTLTDKPVVVNSVNSAEGIAHLCFYMMKPNYQCKSVGPENSNTGKRSVYSVEKEVRPAYTLRVAEILSHFTLPELILTGGDGVKLRKTWLQALGDWLCDCKESPAPLMDPAEFWNSIKPARLSGSPIRVKKPKKQQSGAR
ncbi:hypothetical protein SPH9361_04275 [Sphingobium sp. CECT 9361]|nr:hypothetical protein SPH9361_04275 [Sphingobium sp. CECT 9361]